MGYKDENIKHRTGVSLYTKVYKCPKCNGNIATKASMVICSHCKSVIDGEELM